MALLITSLLIAYGLMFTSVFNGTLFNLLLNIELFGMGSFFFLMICVLMMIAESDDNEMIPIFPLFLGYVVLNHRYGTINVMDWVMSNFQYLPFYIGGYLLIGALWTLPKLKMFIKKNYRSKFSSLSQENYEREASKIIRENRPRIYGWIVYWPFNIVYTMTNDMMKEVLEWITNRFGRIYKNIVISEMKKAGHED